MNKNTALAVAVAFLAGAAVGHYVIPESPAAAESKAAMPPGHDAMMAGHGDMSGGHAAMGGEAAHGDGCDMKDCGPEMAALEARIQQNPKDIEALMGLASCGVSMGDTVMAGTRLSKAVILAEDAPTLVQAGILYERMGEAGPALIAFNKALISEPKNAEALYRAGLVSFHNLGEQKKAVEYWKRYLAVQPDAPNAEMIKRAIEHLSAKG